MLVSKIDFQLDQFLPSDDAINNGIKEEYEKVNKEPAQRIVDDNENNKDIIDFLLEHSSTDTYFTPTKVKIAVKV